VHGKSLEEMTYEDYLRVHSDLNGRKLPENAKLILKYLYELTDGEKHLKLYNKIGR